MINTLKSRFRLGWDIRALLSQAILSNQAKMRVTEAASILESIAEHAVHVDVREPDESDPDRS